MLAPSLLIHPAVGSILLPVREGKHLSGTFMNVFVSRAHGVN